MRGVAILGLGLVLALGAAAWLAGVGRDGVRRGAPGSGGAARNPSAPAASEVGGALADPSFPAEPDAAPSPEREALAAAPGAATAGPAWVVLTLRAKESGRPLADVHAQLGRTSWGSRPDFSVSMGEIRCSCPATDAEGRVELEARPGEESTLFVNVLQNVQAQPATHPVPALAPGERFVLELALATQDDLVWFARVLDDETGAPLAGVSAEWVAEEPLGPRGTVVSSADGLLAVAFASWQATELVLDVPGYLARTLALERGHERPERATPIRLVRPAALAVRVRDAHGAALPEVRVELAFAESTDFTSPPAAPTRTVPTDREGLALFDELPPREELALAVRAGIGRTQRQSLALAPGETRALEFVVGSGCRVQGLAVDEQGAPLAELDLWRLGVAGVRAHLEPDDERAVVDKARTDAEGRFVLENVPAGDWWIGPAPHHRRAGLLALATRVTIAEGESVHPLTLVCRSARYLDGQVLSAGGLPVKAVVTASQGGESLSAQSGRDGRFQVGPLAGGEWVLQARELLGADGPSEPVRAEAGQTDVLLRLRAGQLVSGVVLDEQGAPVPGAEVELLGGFDGFWQMTFSDEAGRFSFGGQVSGEYALRATSGATAGMLGPFSVDERRAPVPVTLELALGAELCLRLARGAPEDLELRISVNGSPLAFAGLAPGGERCERLPPGPAVVQLVRRAVGSPAALLEERSLALSAGATLRLELTGSAAPSPPR